MIVTNQGRLTKFLDKRKEWFDLYDGTTTEPNSIQRQLQLMVFSELSHRVLIKEQRDQQSDSLPSIPVLGYVLEGSYYATQILAIRRLLDKTPNVHSLRRVLDDVKANKELITRENYVSFDGKPYETAPLTLGKSGLQLPDSPFSAQMTCRQRHEQFDALSKQSASTRNRNDTIHSKVFDRLENWLSVSGAAKLQVISHKYLAHAATATSRGNLGPSGLDFREVEAAQRGIIRVTRAIYDILLVSGVFSPVVMMHSLGYFGTVWDERLMSMIASTTRMQASWDALEEERNKWAFGIDDDLFR